jgi:competence protein ComEC
VTTDDLLRRYPHVLAAALCGGLAAANAVRAPWAGVAFLAVVLSFAAVAGEGTDRLLLFAASLALAGWWWGSGRLEGLDRSALEPEAGRAERCLVVVTAPARRSRFELRVPAQVRRFGRQPVREAVLLELPLGRAPPQGALLEVLGVIVLPRGPADGFDERTWLRRHGVHVVLRGDRWRVVGHRGGLGGVADRVRSWLAGSAAAGLSGERRAILAGVVLGDDQGLSDELRQRFRASGLYHLLAVSGQNVAFVACGALVLAWLLGVPRLVGEVGALAAVGAYVLAVGPQPSVVRAGIAGALGSLAWLAARPSDRWYFLLLGAIALLGWNPYLLLDAGFELSFAAVVAIFALTPRLQRMLEGYPLPKGLADAIAVSGACGLATAPIAWFQFHAVPIVAVPANAMAAPAVLPLLVLALAAAAVSPLSPSAATALAWLNGWCAAYLAACARLIGGLPFAQVSSGRGAAALLAVALLGAAWLLRRRRVP